MTALDAQDQAALKAIEGALALPNGDALAVLRLYRVQCEKAERERVLDHIGRALQYVDGPDIFRVDGDHWRELLLRLRGEP